MTPNLLTEAEAAKALHVCTRTMRRLRQSGAVRFVAVTPRTILYRPEDIAAFVEQRAQVCQNGAPTQRTRPSRRKQEATVISFTARRAQRKAAGR